MQILWSGCSYQDGLGRTTQTLDHVVVVHILIWDKRKSQINEYSDYSMSYDHEEVFNFFELFESSLWLKNDLQVAEITLKT